MYNLIRNENMKVYRRWRTWIMVGLMIAAVLTGSIVEWYYNTKDAQPAAWQEVVTQERQSYAEALNDPELHPETKKFFAEQTAIADYRLEHNIRPASGTMWGGINGSAELVVLITLFTVIIAGDSVAGEFSTGTIKLLLILFIVSVLVNGLLYQFNHMDLPLLSVNAEGKVFERNMVGNLWKTYLLNGVSTIIFVTVAFMISTVFRSNAMAIGVSIFALFTGAALMELLQQYEWSKYLLFANIDLSQHLNGRPYQEGMTLQFSITVLAVHFIIFNVISWLVFTKRDVAA